MVLGGTGVVVEGLNVVVVVVVDVFLHPPETGVFQTMLPPSPCPAIQIHSPAHRLGAGVVFTLGVVLVVDEV